MNNSLMKWIIAALTVIFATSIIIKSTDLLNNDEKKQWYIDNPYVTNKRFQECMYEAGISSDCKNVIDAWFSINYKSSAPGL